MENVQNTMAKNKKLKHVLSYFALVILVILLFVPLAFKIMFKDKKEVETKTNVVTILKCTKNKEEISSTFLNNEPQNLSYKLPKENVTGDQDENKGDETTEQKTENKEVVNVSNTVLQKLMNYSSITYDDEKGTASISFSVSSARGSIDYETIFYDINAQESYFKSQGFTCNQTKV